MKKIVKNVLKRHFVISIFVILMPYNTVNLIVTGNYKINTILQCLDE